MNLPQQELEDGKIAYGLSTSLLSGTDVQSAIAMAVDAGFGLLEVSAGRIEWFQDVRAVRLRLDEAGVKVRSVHAPSAGWKLADPDEEIRRAAVEATCGCLAPAVDMGAEIVVCHCNAPGGEFAASDYAPSIARSIESLRIVAAEAGRLAVRLAVETMIPRGQKRPAQKVSEILEIIEGLGDHVGICLDTGHSHAGGNDIAAEAIAAGDKLFATHLQDNHGVAGQDEHLMPGEGTIDWHSLLDALDGMGFMGTRTFEIAAASSPAEAARKIVALAKLRDEWQKR